MSAEVELPRYRSHKVVRALKILSLELNSEGARLVPLEAGYGAFQVDWGYVKKHEPVAGGYYVRDSDGCESWSSAEAFEAGCTRVTEDS